MSKQKTQKLTLRLNYTHQRKDGSFQTLLEVRNYTSQIMRLKVMLTNTQTGELETLYLKPIQLEKGIIISSNIANHPKAQHLNKLIDGLKNNVKSTIYYLTKKGIEINKQNIEKCLYNDLATVLTFVEKAAYSIAVESDDEIQVQLEQHLKEVESNNINYLPTGIYEALEYFKFENIKNYTLKPIVKKYAESLNQSDVIIKYFNDVEFKKFVEFIKSTTTRYGAPFKLQTIQGIIKELKRFLKQCKAKGVTIDETLFDYTLSIGKKTSDIKYQTNKFDNNFSLRLDELDRIINTDLSNQPIHLQNARDLFLIQIYCGGLRFGDLQNLKKESFVKINDKWKIISTAEKTGKVIKNELPDQAVNLLEKYDFDISSIKFTKNEYYNESLKELGKLLGFNREIYLFDNFANTDKATGQLYILSDLFTSKLARKSIVSILFNSGVPINRIIKFTQHSSKAIDNYINSEMEETNKANDLNNLFRF